MASQDLAIIIRATDQASGPLRAIGAQIANLGKAASLPGKAFGGMLDGLGKVGLAGMGVQALTSSVSGLGQALGVGLNSEMEQVRAKMNAFTKDTALTEQILADVRVEANKTPFAFKELADATASLLPVSKASGIGIKDLMKEAQILAASNPMEGMKGASFSLKEAMTGDFTSIIERFNLSRSSINQWKKEGVSNLEIVRRAMKEMGLDAELVSKMGETLEGRWSTFNDTIDTLKMKISEPIFNALKEGLMGLQGFLDANSDALAGFAEALAGGIKDGIAFAGQAFVGLTDNLASLLGLDPGEFSGGMDTLAGIFKRLQELALPLGAALAATAVVLQDSFGTIRQALAGDWSASDSIDPVVNAIGELALIVREHGPTIAAVIGGIAVAFAALSVLGTIVGLIASVSAGFAAMSAAVTVAGGVIPAVLAALGGPVTLLAVAIGLLFVAWQTNFLGIQDVVAAAWAFIAPIIQAILTEVGRFTTEMLPLATAAWANMAAVVTAVAAALWAAIQAGVAGLVAFWTEHHATIEAVASAIWAAISHGIQAQWDLVSGVIRAGLQLLSGDWQGAWQTMADTVSSIWGHIQAAVGPAWAGIAGAIQGALNGIISAAASAGSGMVQAFADAVTSRAYAALNAVRNIVQQIRDLLPSSDAKVGPLSDLTKSGQALARTFARGVDQTAYLARAAVGEALPAAVMAGGFGGQSPASGGAASRAGGGGNTYVYLTVTGSVVTEQDLLEALRRGMIQTGRRNGGGAAAVLG